MKSVLAGTKVLDFSRIFAGPDAAQTLGDLGADVLKIEDPGKGDGCRSLGTTDPKMMGYGPTFQAFNRNKRSMTLDLKSDEGREIARKLIADADVVISNFRTGTMDKFGLGYEDVRKLNPRLIYCELHAFGDKGPMSHIGANDLQLQAHSGLAAITGDGNGPPNRAGSAIVDLHAGMSLVAGVLAAIIHRDRTGEGQKVTTSLLQSSAHLMGYFYQEYWVTGYVHRAMGTATHLSVPNQAFPTKDGYTVIIAPTQEMYLRCVEALEAPHLLTPPFDTREGRMQNRDALIEVMSEVTRQFTSQEVYERMGRVKVNVAIVQDVAQAANHPQLEAIGGIHHAEIDGEDRRFVASPFTMSETPTAFRTPAPRLGAHTDEVLSSLGYSAEEIAALHQNGAV
ncbi:CaiB/BaiF CoA transferase family protein [Falsigemmobacter intermedius]|uniref:CaiB/BaiF CoA transferase family protein n=1 Tax=Falsigemmobacter intermedius TaxID=1553448 RepID=UPI003EFF900C